MKRSVILGIVVCLALGCETREEREARLARALRDNLRKRKAQTRERATRRQGGDGPKGGKA